MRTNIYLTLLLASCTHVLLYSQAQDRARSNSISPSAILSSKLTFREPDRNAPIRAASVVMNGPPQCGPNGLSFLVFMVPPPYYNEAVVSSVSAAGRVIQYAPESIPDLKHASIVYFDPGITDVVMLLRTQSAGDAMHSPVRYFLALFDYDGKFRHDAELDSAFEPAQVIQLDKDTFLLAGIDMSTGQVTFDLIDDNGTAYRRLSEDSVMPSDQQMTSMLSSLSFVGMDPKSQPLSQKMSMVLSLLSPVHSQRGLLILEPGSEGKVIEMSRSGEIRQVKLQLPSNQVAQSMITRKNEWFVRTSLQGAESESNLYQVDPESGKTIRAINTSGVPASSIACPTETGFYGFRWIDQKPYVIEGTLSTQ